MKKVALELNPNTWDKYGLTWLRTIKSKGYSALVVNDQLSLAAISKIKDLNFDLTDKTHKHGGVIDFYNAIAKNIENDDQCLAITNEMPTNFDKFFDFKNITCEIDAISLAEIVFPIIHLTKRVEVSRLLEQHVMIKGGLLNTKTICAHREGWQLFCGLFDFLMESQFVDVRIPFVEKIVFNILAGFYPNAFCVI
jgi:hypothetical protein